jgi:hypothetical protein
LGLFNETGLFEKTDAHFELTPEQKDKLTQAEIYFQNA